MFCLFLFLNKFSSLSDRNARFTILKILHVNFKKKQKQKQMQLTRPQRDEETTCFKMLHLTKNAFHNFNLLSA